MKTFKDGQKVRHPKYGEGIIEIFDNQNIYGVEFDDVVRAISTIGDDFYNQLEAVEDLPEVGEYAYFWDEGSKECVYAKFGGINEGSDYKYKKYDSVTCYHNISKTPPKID